MVSALKEYYAKFQHNHSHTLRTAKAAGANAMLGNGIGVGAVQVYLTYIPYAALHLHQ